MMNILQTLEQVIEHIYIIHTMRNENFVLGMCVSTSVSIGSSTCTKNTYTIWYCSRKVFANTILFDFID